MTSSPEPVLTRIVESLRRLLAAGTLRLGVECTPMPAPRPRVMKWGGVFYPKRYVEYTAIMQKAFAEQSAKALEGPLVAAVIVTAARPKKTILFAPRGDADNHAKGPLDAITKTARVWLDDDQVHTLLVHKRWGEPGEPAGVRVLVANLETDHVAG